jgi:hypothetical protein
MIFRGRTSVSGETLSTYTGLQLVPGTASLRTA